MYSTLHKNLHNLDRRYLCSTHLGGRAIFHNCPCQWWSGPSAQEQSYAWSRTRGTFSTKALGESEIHWKEEIAVSWIGAWVKPTAGLDAVVNTQPVPGIERLSSRLWRLKQCNFFFILPLTIKFNKQQFREQRETATGRTTDESEFESR
jgi:hypothetical protein